IHISILTKLSPNMAEILNIPHGPISEEGTERFPLHVPGLTVQEFDDFLFCIYKFEWTPMVDLDLIAKDRVFTNLLKVSSLWEIEDCDIARIGVKVYSILAKGIERMEIEMRRTANVEPPMTTDPDWECKNHGACIATWKRLWWDRVGRKLLHPDNPLKATGIVAEVKKFAHRDLNEQCKSDMVREIEIIIVFVDQRVIAGVVSAIVEYHGSL
ncbi:hypothetical protein C8R45DRAFT_834099, partial [Mycena sanguinolenta]